MKKVIFTSILLVSLVISSFMVSASSNDRAAEEAVLPIAAATIENETEAAGILYTKTTDIFPDGRISATYEQWIDLITLEKRNDRSYMSSAGEVSNTSFYSLDGAKTFIHIIKDEAGNPISGTITPYSDRVASYNHSLVRQHSDLSAIKEEYNSSEEWSKEGILYDNDGKAYVIQTKNYQTVESKPILESSKKQLIKSDVVRNINIKESVYIDISTGLPVKKEIYSDIAGEPVLIQTHLYEFRYLNSDESIFDTTSYELDALPLVDFDPNNGVG